MIIYDGSYKKVEELPFPLNGGRVLFCPFEYYKHAHIAYVYWPIIRR